MCIRDRPYWVYIVILSGAAVARVVYSALWSESRKPWHRNAYIGTSMAVIGVVSYCSGWGPILSIGFLFGAAVAFNLFGSQATVPCLAWTAAAIALGQIAVALHLAPTIIHEPVVMGVACLGLVGACLLYTSRCV